MPSDRRAKSFREGLALPSETRKKVQPAESGEETVQSDLALVVEVWIDLPTEVRAAVVAYLRAMWCG